MENKIKVGDEVWVVPGRYYSKEDPFAAVVEKVGRKYFTIKHGWSDWRFSLETLKGVPDTFSSRARVYLDREDYDREQLFDKLSSAIRKRVGDYGVIKGVTLDQLQGVAAILGVTV